MKYSTLYFLLFLCVTQPSVSQQNNNFYFSYLKVEDGLPQNTVSTILQDSKGFMWFGTKDGLARYDGYRFHIFRCDPNNNKSGLGSNYIHSLFEDNQGTIWAGTDYGVYTYNAKEEAFSKFRSKTQDRNSITSLVIDIKQDKKGCLWFSVKDQGLFRYNASLKKLDCFKGKNNTLIAYEPRAIYIDNNNDLWLGTLGGGLLVFDSKSDDLILSNENQPSQSYIYCIIENDDKSLLLGTSDNGVLLFDKQTKILTPFFNAQKNSMFVRSLLWIGAELWIGTESGIFIYNKNNKLFTNIRNNNHKYSLSSNAVYSIIQDKEQGIWVGTFFGGINYLPANFRTFEKYFPIMGQNSISGKAVREFCEDKNGNLWIGTEDNGLNLYNPQTKLFKNYLTSNSSIAYHNIHALLIDGDYLWIGYYTKGIDVMNLKTGVIKHITLTDEYNTPTNNSIYTLLKDKRGNIWIGTMTGLFLMDEKTKSIKKIKETDENHILCTIQDDEGQIWVATYSEGVFCFNPVNKKWIRLKHNEKDPFSLSSNKITDIFEDRKKRLWISTEGGGVNVITKNSKLIKTYTTQNGLLNNVVYKTIEDDLGMIWLSTNKGLARLNPETAEITDFTYANGLLNNQFNYRSGLKARNGRLYFGCIDGFISFNPRNIFVNTNIPAVTFTGFQISNQDVIIGNRIPLSESIVSAKEVLLKHNQSTFSFDFAVLSYNAPQMNKYAYKMEGFDKDWIKLDNTPKVTYSNLPIGKYTFKVIGANSDGVWNETGASIIVKVLPPWWLAIYAKIIYCLLFSLILYYVIHTYRKRIQERNRQFMERVEQAKERSIQKAKMEFFTSITHEIRTPLTLIKSPLEEISKSTQLPSDFPENIEIMRTNLDRLLSLTNELLDFSKAENQGFVLHVSYTDINKVIENILYQFKQTFKEKNIYLQTSLPESPFFAYIDAELITKVISNLIQNSSKFAENIIIVELIPDKPDIGWFTLKVSNDGKNILPQNREKIFNSFFQEHSEKMIIGTGLGLPLVKKLIELHKGNVYIETENTDLNCFVVEIPQNNPTVNKLVENLDRNEEPENNEGKNTNNQTTVLVVDDDEGMRNYLKKILSKNHKFLVAADGEAAIKLLKNRHIDLVISDIMMPNINGYQLCETIKTDLEYSHIPVILLTSKTDTDSRIEGLDCGADAYIIKPFSVDHFLAQITNLLNKRKLYKEAFFNIPSISAISIANSKIDEQFIKRITDIILKNITDEYFSIDQIAEDMNMSRSSLYRKIKEISSLAPNDFIRLVRLKKAAELLLNNSCRINEISYLVGFSSPSYFTKCFQKQFNMLPKEYKNQQNCSEQSYSSQIDDN